MYFFRLEPLRDQLVGQGLTERDRLKYVMAWMLGQSFLVSQATGIPEGWQTSYFAMDLLVTFFGVVYAWRCHGRDAGSGFFDRFFSIGWVVNFRVNVIAWVVLSVCSYLPGFKQFSELFESAGGFASSFASGDDEPAEAGPGAAILVLTVAVNVYIMWSIGRNIRRVREETERRGGAPVPMSPAPAMVTAAGSFGSAPARPVTGLESPAPRLTSGMDRFVESVVQRELSQGGLGGRPRRRSTIRPLKSSRRPVARRKSARVRKPVRRTVRRPARRTSRRR